ncbi:MAG: SpoIIIAH-like protein [Bacillota bacterium]|jgi:stage III sporulation protein AH|nr:SpoIIIAH-like protein [Bacillota bacterium]
MILKKETLVFLTSLAIIFIIGYVNLTMSPKDEFNPDEYAQMQEEVNSEEASVELVETNDETDPSDTTEATDETQTSDATTEVADEEKVAGVTSDDKSISEILGDITDITDIAALNGNEEKTETDTEDKSSSDTGKDSAVAGTNSEEFNISFSNFKLSKEKSNMDIVDQLESNLSNGLISENTKKQFEDLLLNKNNYIKKEQSIELMLQTKGYDESIVVVDENMIKVITNDTIEQADATKILDIVVSETSYDPSQIKIVKFDNIDL